MIIYVNVMLTYVNNIDEKYFLKNLIYVNFMTIYANITYRQTYGQTNISKL